MTKTDAKFAASSQILNLFQDRGWLITTAESCTGGLLMGALTDVPGASAIVDRGFVTYTNDAKMDMLGVRSDTLARFGAVSEAVAREMALGALSYSQAHVSVSVTGIAGPGGSEHKPEGRVCFGIAIRGGDVDTDTVEFGAIGRHEVREASVLWALERLVQMSL